MKPEPNPEAAKTAQTEGEKGGCSVAPCSAIRGRKPVAVCRYCNGLWQTPEDNVEHNGMSCNWCMDQLEAEEDRLGITPPHLVGRPPNDKAQAPTL